MRSVLLCVVALTALAGSVAADTLATAEFVRTVPLGTPSVGTRSVTPGAVYSNWTNFSGSAYANGGAALINNIATTKYVSEEINMTSPCPMTQFSFSVANLGTAPISARARVRFHDLNNGGGTNTGTYITGYSFTAMAFPVGVSTWYATVAANPLPQNFSIGITFDNSGTTTPLADMNLLGVGIYNPIDVGSSPDLAFSTTAASVGNVSNAPGATFNFAGNPPANFGWEIVPEPSSLTLLAGLGLLLVRRR
jgi:hypothetical protein